MLTNASRLAAGLHSASVHLLRALRKRDVVAGITAPRLSALSVIVFTGPLSLTELASAEQVRPPTMTRIVQGLERSGLVIRWADPVDRRAVRIEATAKGRKLLQRAREARLASLATGINGLSAREVAELTRAAEVMERLAASIREQAGDL
jgi:DNA-binding MarR family transcriptional regulator